MENTYGGVCEPNWDEHTSIAHTPDLVEYQGGGFYHWSHHTDAEELNYTIRNEIRKTVMSVFANFVQSPLDKMSIWNRCVRITEVHR